MAVLCLIILLFFFPSSESEALKLFLEKFVARIIPEYMSQRDFLTCVANDAFLAQVSSQTGWGRIETY
jgi:hypothetical protein